VFVGAKMVPEQSCGGVRGEGTSCWERGVWGGCGGEPRRRLWLGVAGTAIFLPLQPPQTPLKPPFTSPCNPSPLLPNSLLIPAPLPTLNSPVRSRAPPTARARAPAPRPGGATACQSRGAAGWCGRTWRRTVGRVPFLGEGGEARGLAVGGGLGARSCCCWRFAAAGCVLPGLPPASGFRLFSCSSLRPAVKRATDSPPPTHPPDRPQTPKPPANPQTREPGPA
jgi:hypothetical protein